MPGVGYQDNLSRTSLFSVTRDELIRLAFETAGIIPDGEAMSADQLEQGKKRLNLIIREIDESGKWRWSIQDAIHVPLSSGVAVYDGNNGLPVNIAELQSVVYRSATGNDSKPLNILSAEAYEQITDKLAPGEPTSVFLTEDRNIEQRRLYVWPVPATVNAQSKVLGTDDVIYRCVYPHTASETNRPTIGPNWHMVWEIGTGSTSTWTTGTKYTIAESLRILHRRPIFDMTEAEHVTDFPAQSQRLLVYRLASDLADAYPAPMDERTLLAAKIKGAYSDIFDSLRPKSRDIHNKVKYF